MSPDVVVFSCFVVYGGEISDSSHLGQRVHHFVWIQSGGIVTSSRTEPLNVSTCATLGLNIIKKR